MRTYCWWVRCCVCKKEVKENEAIADERGVYCSKECKNEKEKA